MRNVGPASFSALVGNNTCGADGLCYSDDFLTKHPWKSVDWNAATGSYKTYKFPSPDIAADPRYVIEYTQEPGCERRHKVSEIEKPRAYDKYRITANAKGLSTSANVRLQSVYKKRFGTCG